MRSSTETGKEQVKGNGDVGGQELLSRFVQRGFTGLYRQPLDLAAYLKTQATSSGMPSLALIADVLTETYLMFLEHEESGGVQMGFVQLLDGIVKAQLPEILATNNEAFAIALRERVRELLSSYNPDKAEWP